MGGRAAHRWMWAALAAPLTAGMTLGLVGAAGAQSSGPVYKDPRRPVAARVEDLLSRMTLAEKVGQMQAIWENKGDIQNPDGSFSEAKAEKAYPDGLGEITRPSDLRGVN